MFTVSCEHISYALSGYPVPTVSASGNAQVAINAILTAAKNQLGKDTGFFRGDDRYHSVVVNRTDNSFGARCARRSVRLRP